MQYMILIYEDPAQRPELGQETEAWTAVTQELAASGGLRGGAGLQPVETATTVRVRDEQVLTTDGPFAETKEVLGGYYVIDVPDLDEALRWAAKMPNAGRGSVEVRPVLETPANA